MGNDSSRLTGLMIDKSAIESNGFWTLYNAEMPTSHFDGKQLLSVFQGEICVNTQLWLTQGPMERAIKNFMIYRHPYILKYVATWEQSGRKHLATERVQPLNTEITNLSDIQVCLGLRTILCSLIFLTEKAHACHLNICTSSIMVAADSSWRLAGFEYVWKGRDVTSSLLDLSKSLRYKAAIDPNETKDNHGEYIQQYAFGVLCEEILAMRTASGATAPYVHDFLDYCRTHLKHSKAQMRPKLSAVLLHPYFNHEFVLIHSFLTELPLKSISQKQEFFTDLIDRLRAFDDDMVAKQFSALLLSRMVLLDPTAQLCVTPYVLKTRSDHAAALFSSQTYSRYLMPHIKRKFRIRDAQIRLILLEYFMEFVRLLPKDEVQTFILLHLQDGMRDTNDILVAKTLRCLADLIPILGSEVVVGGERVRIFADGRPQAALSESTSHWVEPRSITPVMGDSVTEYMVSSSPLPEAVDPVINDGGLIEDGTMPPRLSPDGGEDDKISTLIDSVLISDDNQKQRDGKEITPPTTGTDNVIDKQRLTEQYVEESWSDWENDDMPTNGNCMDGASITTTPSIYNGTDAQSSLAPQASHSSIMSKTSYNSLKTIADDLNSLDIIVQKTVNDPQGNGDEFDYFKDMEPIIETLSNHTVYDRNRDTVKTLPMQILEDDVQIDANRFALVASDNNVALGESNGWNEEEEDECDNSFWNNT